MLKCIEKSVETEKGYMVKWDLMGDYEV